MMLSTHAIRAIISTKSSTNLDPLPTSTNAYSRLIFAHLLETAVHPMYLHILFDHVVVAIEVGEILF